MRLIQSIDNISWTIHEKDGKFFLTVWRGDGCDMVYTSQNQNLQWVKDDLVNWIIAVLAGKEI